MQVDLVLYKQGKRELLGKIDVAEDGALAGQVTKDAWSILKERFNPEVGEIVLAPVPDHLKG